MRGMMRDIHGRDMSARLDAWLMREPYGDTCADCGEALTENGATYDDGNYYCPDCLEPK